MFSTFWALQIFFAKLGFNAGALVLPFQLLINIIAFLILVILILPRVKDQFKQLFKNQKPLFWKLYLANGIQAGLGTSLAMAGIALVLQSLAESGMKLRDKISQMPRYHIVKEKIPFRGDLSGVGPALAGEFEGRIDETDGMRIDMEPGWIHVRASNTEPVVRIIAEADSPEEARTLAGRAGSILRSATGGER